MAANTCSVADLRYALKHLFEPRRIRTSPLLAALDLADHANAVSAMREKLVDAIQSLAPENQAGERSPAWRDYEILYYRYIVRSTQQEVADQLGISARHLKREQQRAIEALAERLQEHYAIVFDSSDATEPAEDDTAEDEGVAAGEEDLRWLNQAPPARPVRLHDVVTATLALAQPLAQTRGVPLTVADLSGAPPVAIDAVALRHILLSLLSAALSSAAPGPLAVTWQLSGQDVQLMVQGVDIRQSPGAAGDSSPNLAVARALIAATDCRSTMGEDCVSLLLPTAAPIPILVIDDNVDAQRLLERYAIGTPYHVTGASDAQRVFTAIAKNLPRAIVLDVMMPEVDGWELLGRLRSNPLSNKIPIIACTVLAEDDLAYTLGVNAFLRKPVSRQSFLEALDRLTAQPAPEIGSVPGYTAEDRGPRALPPSEPLACC